MGPQANILRVGSRGSQLALIQAETVCRDMREKLGLAVETVVVRTHGDDDKIRPLEQLDGTGFFSSELEQALLEERIDLAVHSLKDLPTSSRDGLEITALGYREDAADILLVRKGHIAGPEVIPLKDRSIVGTSSARRKAQIWHHNRTLTLKDLRGNIPTRIDKLRAGEYDAILVAAAAINRLKVDLSAFEMVRLNPREFLPAPGQGILALQIRSSDRGLSHKVKKLNDPNSETAARLERGLLARFRSGCTLPLGTYSEINDELLTLRACLGKRTADRWQSLHTVEGSGNSVDEVIDDCFKHLNRV